VLTLKQLDLCQKGDKKKIDKLLAELKFNYPEIDWQTESYQYENIPGNYKSNISVVVPSSQFEEAEQIYKELRDKEFKYESSIFDPLMEDIISFRDERNWKQFHNPKDLAISLSLEASELLENFQWKTSEEGIAANLENIKDEIADVVIYAMLMSNELGINLEQTIKEKIRKNNQKYPVNKSFGSSKKYTDL